MDQPKCWSCGDTITQNNIYINEKGVCINCRKEYRNEWDERTKICSCGKLIKNRYMYKHKKTQVHNHIYAEKSNASTNNNILGCLFD